MTDAIDIKIDIPVAQLGQKGERCLKKIKPKLKQRIVRDCNANVPIKTGLLRDSALATIALTDDYIIWNTPYAHFQHTGKVMIGEHSHSPFAQFGEKKIYTNRNLTYRQGGAGWVPKTAAAKAESWMKLGRSLFKKEFDR